VGTYLYKTKYYAAMIAMKFIIRKIKRDDKK